LYTPKKPTLLLILVLFSHNIFLTILVFVFDSLLLYRIILQHISPLLWANP